MTDIFNKLIYVIEETTEITCKKITYENNVFILDNKTQILYLCSYDSKKFVYKIIGHNVTDMKKSLHGITYHDTNVVYGLTLDGTGPSGCVGDYPRYW